MLFTRSSLTACRDNTSFHRPNSGVDIDFRCQGLSRIYLLLQMRQESLRIKKYTMPAYRLYDRDPGSKHLTSEILDLTDPGPDMIVVYRFGNTDSHSFHIPACKTAVGMK